MSGVKAGIMVGNQHFEGVDMVSALEEQITMVRLARDRGWDGFFCGQHYLNEGGNQGLQMVPYLARLAADAGDMTLGVGLLLLPLHNPVYTAETIATLDVISRGNMIFGVGLGYRSAEFEAFGVRKGERVRRFAECLSVAKRLWTEDRVSYESETCVLRDAHLSLRCVQKPHPPIWFAAKHANAIRRAAQLGDCLYHSPKATLAIHKARLALYREELRKAGRPLPKENPCRIEIYCAKSRAAAMELGAPYMAEKYKAYARWERDKAMPDDERIDKSFDDLVRDRFVIGSPEDCWNQLEPYVTELGVTYFVFRTHFLGMPLSSALASLRLISGELLPALRRARPTPLERAGAG
ncbi:MAG: LLM class flavin-dependent oxidoreductase [Burkholderiales bacterium]|nr:LLM class flavin-dependent oxidoreductase [Burkholderiales bacterium]